MFYHEDNLCEEYGVTDEDFAYGMDNALHFQEEHTHLFNAASHLFFEWCQTGSEKNHFAAKKMIDNIRDLMAASSHKNLAEKILNDKIWYSALMCSEDL